MKHKSIPIEIKLLIVIFATIFLLGCKDNISATQTPLQVPYTQPLFVNEQSEDISDSDEIDESQSDDLINVTGVHGVVPFEIYEIKGTADSVSGNRWDNMMNWRSEASDLAEQYRDIVFLNLDPAENAVYLTFDDGPDPKNTVSVINTLLEYGVSGTFFFTGENMRRYEDVVKLAYDAGFAIGLHSYSHPNYTNLSESELIADLNDTNDVYERITGSRAAIMRPPYGAVSHREIAVIDEHDLLIYLWSLDTLDWAQTDANEILRNITEHIRPGDIILMHAFSGQSRSAAILPKIIEFILEQGYEIKALPSS